jgi:hypothetical protein
MVPPARERVASGSPSASWFYLWSDRNFKGPRFTYMHAWLVLFNCATQVVRFSCYLASSQPCTTTPILKGVGIPSISLIDSWMTGPQQHPYYAYSDALCSYAYLDGHNESTAYLSRRLNLKVPWSIILNRTISEFMIRWTQLAWISKAIKATRWDSYIDRCRCDFWENKIFEESTKNSRGTIKYFFMYLYHCTCIIVYTTSLFPSASLLFSEIVLCMHYHSKNYLESTAWLNRCGIWWVRAHLDKKKRFHSR